ncbi:MULTISPECIES: helix-turn-helix domain-containing protein [Bacteroidales]|uniref:DNA-binding helix-turn-helix protein n=1 Tax=Segatella buccae ATCC 33574 TaxID=873513 RepID=E6K6R9_9BACT|nr:MULTISPECIES: helix-turn-helix domain-containing protein [Bacteroidales]EFU30749.1 DNA-binding helix-turn-helix protein [Segatella buccae ATCC 33574]MCE2616425.1 helix-turn-helix domain-containing protein [Phocaeicola oris]
MKISEAQYKYAQRRVEELLEVVTDTTLPTSPESMELSIMSTFVEEYEKKHHPIEKLTLAEVIKQGLKAKGMTQKDLSQAVGLSTSRISDFTQGKSEPTLATAGEICRVLDIMPEAMLSL